MNVGSEIKLYSALSKKIGGENARMLISFINAKVEEQTIIKKSSIKESDLKMALIESKTNLFKWMLICLMIQVAVTACFILLFLKK